ncbi:hypothetical protein [Microcoleus sp. Pol11C3]|uniref:hypothetical protein n=1 Tax=Microcoleus sp. Pol11C3 TaxID=3055390 RepID=UPI002FD1AC6F
MTYYVLLTLGFLRKPKNPAAPHFNTQQGGHRECYNAPLASRLVAQFGGYAVHCCYQQLWAVQLDFWATRAASSTSKATFHLKA